jgi:hypothetical protein
MVPQSDIFCFLYQLCVVEDVKRPGKLAAIAYVTHIEKSAVFGTFPRIHCTTGTNLGDEPDEISHDLKYDEGQLIVR